MAATIHISAVCSISNQTIIKNGEALFTNDDVTTTGFLVAAYKHLQLNYTRFYKMDNLSKLGWLATEVLLKDNFNKGTYKVQDIGVVLANSNSSLDSDLRYMASVTDIASPALFVYTLPNIMIGEISIRNNFKGEAAFFIAGAFDADFIRQYVQNLFDNDMVTTCMCGWVDVIGDEYLATLFLIEKGIGKTAFTAANMDKQFNKVIVE
jgi:hypothetical protein